MTLVPENDRWHKAWGRNREKQESIKDSIIACNCFGIKDFALSQNTRTSFSPSFSRFIDSCRIECDGTQTNGRLTNQRGNTVLSLEPKDNGWALSNLTWTNNVLHGLLLVPSAVNGRAEVSQYRSWWTKITSAACRHLYQSALLSG